jgi:hypothetical protein
MDDITLVANQQYVEKGKGNEVKEGPLYTWVPPTVLGTGTVVEEPRWAKLERMNLVEFYTGLQRRNWTSEYHDPSAVPWKLDFYQVPSCPCPQHRYQAVSCPTPPQQHGSLWKPQHACLLPPARSCIQIMREGG